MVRVDGARFLPSNVTISRVLVMLESSSHEQLAKSLVQVGVWGWEARSGQGSSDCVTTAFGFGGRQAGCRCACGGALVAEQSN